LDDVPLGALAGALLVLILCSAFFSGTETALMCLNRYRLRHLAAKGHRGAQLAESLLRRPDRLIGVILFGNNLVNNAAAALVAVIALRLGGPAGLAVGTIFITLLLLVFGEVTPKTLGATQPERLAFPGAYVFYGLLRFLPPLNWTVQLINLISNGLLRLFGIRAEDVTSQHLTLDELRTILAESGAMLPRKRHEIMMRVLELGDITVEDIMVPQNEVVGIDLDDDWATILETIRTSGYTRLPVYREAMDNVVGLLHVKQLIRHPAPQNLTRGALEALLDEPYFVPEGTPLNKQLVQFQRSRQRTGFVVDEYGDIQGIVTMEDLLEEIVGEFTSEPEPARSEVRRDESAGGFVVDAGVNVRVLNRMMNWRLPTDGPKTLNGLILEKLGAIPRKGTGLMLNDYAVEVLETSDNVVESVRIREPAEAPPRLAAGG
jgi:Mg2+/Co2+ transporter CorB